MGTSIAPGPTAFIHSPKPNHRMQPTPSKHHQPQVQSTACKRSTSCQPNNPFQTSETPGSSSSSRAAWYVGAQPAPARSPRCRQRRSGHGARPCPARRERRASSNTASAATSTSFLSAQASNIGPAAPALSSASAPAPSANSTAARICSSLRTGRSCASVPRERGGTTSQRCATPSNAHAYTGGSGSSSSSYIARALRSVSTVTQCVKEWHGHWPQATSWPCCCGLAQTTVGCGASGGVCARHRCAPP
ncbi:hypothetical protein EDB89DRAFT_344964 [Lactarius sanguifluus]|nr:hypothetical protein EDB89DRAFT_344964 [Lactarius sanguifluus]